MGVAEQRARAWMWRCLGLGALLMAVGLIPVVGCWLGSLGVLPARLSEVMPEYLALESAGWSQCVSEHPLGSAALYFFGGMLSLGVGVIFRDVARQRAEDAEELERRVEHVGREVRRTPMLRADMLAGSSEEVPEAIEVGADLDFGKPPAEVVFAEEGASESVMAFVHDEAGEKRRAKYEEEVRQQVREEAQRLDYYVPPGMELAPVVYVDGAFDGEPGEVSDGSMRRPFTSLAEGVRRAFGEVVTQKKAVVVRVRPGVYQEALEVPDRVVIVNDCMPGGESVDARLAWLRAQAMPDHEERVTILAPSEERCALKIRAGQSQGVIGCYLVGREGVAQRGMEVMGSRALAVINCAFEGFSLGAVKVQDAGEELPGRDISFVGCMWKGNASAKRGGGLRVRRSVVKVVASIFDSNRAGRGGAIWAEELAKPLVVERCMMQRNRALGAIGGSEDSETTRGWGGALGLDGGLARVVDTVFDGNDARGAGGAIAVMGGRLVIRATGERRCMIFENRAELGGGIVAIGRDGKAALVKSHDVAVLNNLATEHGGGLAAVGRAMLQVDGGEVSQNRAGDGHGGGVLVRGGGQAKFESVVFSTNQAAGGGGGIAAINASVKVMLGCSLFKNRAGECGGGVLAVSVPDRELAERIGEPGYELPFRVVIEDVKIAENVAGEAGGGVCLGNQEALASFPLILDVRWPEAMVDNRAGVEKSSQLRVSWAGRIEAEDGSSGRIKRRLE
ncbi:hypothetical protein EA187_07195 [Lujinxingia sediminis]|uniref:Right-handed parallel beta-helix repeat-containing protein n=1 Tax=Lujinxingia sediminis TaxID=2480984 RepID=A0ABY0CVT3_9DELT|nr:hypothetical protein [Lujinxingia sediminis]RVU46913.1 hypothetical protein EA187_07195 [Lujinxingia sediminis]